MKQFLCALVLFSLSVVTAVSETTTWELVLMYQICISWVVQLVCAVLHVLLIVSFCMVCCWLFLVSLLMYVRAHGKVQGNTNRISFLNLIIMSAGQGNISNFQHTLMV
jgi:hypothetical protein